MKELSVFVDESGDWGEYDHRAPFYIISLVLHDQEVDITEDLIRLEMEMTNIGWSNHCIHSGPIIRSENEYSGLSLQERQKILRRLMTFTRKANIRFKSFHIEKKQSTDAIVSIGILSKKLAAFIRDNYSLFSDYDSVKIYYDNGQIEVTRMLSSVFNSLLDNVEFKKVLPSKYRLFQVADLICTLRLTQLKSEKHLLSKSELYFFSDARTFTKNYLKPLASKEII